MVVCQETILEILEKIKNGEFSVLHTTQKSFRVFGVSEGVLCEYTNKLAFLNKFNPLENETLEDFQNRLENSKIAKEWVCAEKITMKGGGYSYAGRFLSSLAIRLSKLEGLERFRLSGDAKFNRL